MKFPQRVRIHWLGSDVLQNLQPKIRHTTSGVMLWREHVLSKSTYITKIKYQIVVKCTIPFK